MILASAGVSAGACRNSKVGECKVVGAGPRCRSSAPSLGMGIGQMATDRGVAQIMMRVTLPRSCHAVRHVICRPPGCRPLRARTRHGSRRILGRRGMRVGATAAPKHVTTPSGSGTRNGMPGCTTPTAAPWMQGPEPWRLAPKPQRATTTPQRPTTPATITGQDTIGARAYGASLARLTLWYNTRPLSFRRRRRLA